MKRIWLLLAVFVVAAALLTATLMLPDYWAQAQSTPVATEEPAEEPTEEPTPLPTAEPQEEPTTVTPAAASPAPQSSTEAITDSEGMSDTAEMSHRAGMTHSATMSSTEAISYPTFATAQMQDVDGNIVGTATFSEDVASGTVNISVEISGLTAITEGEHGIHVHQVGLCTPDFLAAGDHFNPNKAEHGLENPDGAHNGDLPNIEIDKDGNATYAVATNLFTLGAGPHSLLAADGSALMIHAMPDDQMTDPSGGSGDRIACGVIVAGGVPMPEAPSAPPPTENATMQPAQRSPSPERIAQLQVAEGFSVTVFAKGLSNVRMMAQDENGIIYVTRPAQGDVIALMDEDGDGVADDKPITATTELTSVHGIVITGNQVYLARPTTIYRGEVLGDGTFGELEVLVDDLPDAGQHGNRTLGFGPDGLLYVSVGSSCNECADPNPERAAILQVQPDGSTRKVFANGLRNTIGFGWHPETQGFWGMDHGSDGHGNDVPDEELNKIEESNNYGWPFCFNNKEVNQYVPTRPQGMTKAEFCEQSTPPVLTYQAHSAPIGLVFYTGDQFPTEYQNNAFVAMRGSWNRMPATGYEVARIVFDEDGQPVGFQPFITGFLIEGGNAHFGRLAGLLVLQDGSLLVSEDTNGMIYRVSYTEPE